ncbi:MAG: anti-sigma factor [Flavobacterium sp.]
MSNRDYIESGILELYIFGSLSETEAAGVREMAAQHADVKAEIIAIEKAVINLSYSIAPHLSAENFERIRQQLIEKHSREEGVIAMPRRRANVSAIIGWAAAVVLMVGLGFQYYKYNEVLAENKKVAKERSKFEQLLATTSAKQKTTEEALAIVRDKATNTIYLEGQQASPGSYARVYVNKQTNQTHVDLSGLPEPPQGQVYQIWALTLDPLTPTSIGIVDDTKANNGIHTVQTFDGAQAFGITLEPAGGSPSPTMEQLYTLGKV